MARRGSGKQRNQPDFVASLPPEDYFCDILKGLLSDIQPGDVNIDPATDQIIYFNRLKGSYSIPETPLTKSQFSHIFGNTQNRPTPVQINIQQGTNCQLRGDFRVRTVALTATSEQNAIAGWNRVLDELGKMPSLRPKKYVVVDKKTHGKVMETEGKKIPKKEEKNAEVISNLREVVGSHMLKKGILRKIKAAIEGNVDLSLDLKAHSLTLTADYASELTQATTEALRYISQIAEQVQTIYWSVPIPAEFAQSLVAVLQLNSDFEEIYGYIPVAEVVFSQEITPLIQGILPKFLPITGGAPVNVNLDQQEIEGNESEVAEITAELANDANTAQLAQLHSLIYQELTHVQATFAPLSAPLSLHIAARGDTRIPSLSLLLPTGLETSSLCLGRIGDFPNIELSLV